MALASRTLATTIALATLAACGGNTPETGAGGSTSATTGSGGAVGSSSSSSTTSSSSGATSSSSGSSSSSSSSSSSTSGAPQPSSGCGVAATAGTTARTLQVNGVARTFTLVIPTGYDPNVAHPILMRFGGLGSTGASSVGGIGLKVPAIIVGPDANPPGGYWDTIGDLALVDAIVDTLSKELCVDEARNFATGYSNGGFMADAVGCKRSAKFKGIAVMEGGTGGNQCGQVGAFLMHNTDDMTVPLSYGTSLRDKWLATNGCSATSHAVMPDPCVAYDGCSAGHPVVWCEPATGGHKPNYTVSLGIGPFFDSL